MVITQCFNHQFGQQLLLKSGKPTDSHGYFWKVLRLVGACFLVPMHVVPRWAPIASRSWTQRRPSSGGGSGGLGRCLGFRDQGLRGEARRLDGRMWAGLPSQKGRRAREEGRKEGLPGKRRRKKERKRERERGGRRCKRAEEEGGRERERSSARKLGEFGIWAEGPEPATSPQISAEYLAFLPDGIPVRAVSSLLRPSPRPSPRFTAAVQRSPGAAAGEPATAGTYGEQG